MSETALFGLLGAIQVSPGLIRTHAMKSQVATLQYFARRMCRESLQAKEPEAPFRQPSRECMGDSRLAPVCR